MSGENVECWWSRRNVWDVQCVVRGDYLYGSIEECSMGGRVVARDDLGECVSQNSSEKQNQ